MTIKRKRGRALQEERERWMRKQPLCVMCLAMDPPRLRKSERLDHIVALVNGGDDSDSNKQMLCVACHKTKTAADLGHRPQERIGPDGFPCND